MTRPAVSTPVLLTVLLAAATLLSVLALAVGPEHEALRAGLIGLTLLPLAGCLAALRRSRGRAGPPLKPFFLAVFALPVVQALGRVALRLAEGQSLQALDVGMLALGSLALLVMAFLTPER
ncbi:hypothetical protein QOL99_15125 [Deinococcus sp. MIMF12]|uniref:Uncharacterized protein n=1 Tax=Deinococcus rhizophilus TaxID=3049544 RepID=A0ABT7JK87_9DEIO|nr:hypothetical protein [Deinococcus rhizophilus]MDL2345471.1 hypothetical protein [Deinococcus rhizophilus]